MAKTTLLLIFLSTLNILFSLSLIRIFSNSTALHPIVVSSASENDPSLHVEIYGAVNKPGGYKLDEAKTIEDLVNLSGGLHEGVDKEKLVTYVDLTTSLSNKQIVYIPFRNDHFLNTILNINTATQDEIVAANLYRIGPALAEKIVAYRDINGPFSSVSELVNVSGIGEKTVEAIRDKVTCN